MPSIEKEFMYQEIVNRTADKSIFFSSMQGMTVAEMESFRKDIRKIDASSFVVKKTLIKKRLRELGIDEMDSLLEHHILLTTIDAELQKASKVLVKYEKDFEKKFAVKGVFADGQIKDRKYVVVLSNLPSKEQLIARLLGSMNAPMTNFVLTLNGVVRAFAVVLNEIKKQKETGGANIQPVDKETPVAAAENNETQDAESKQTTGENNKDGEGQNKEGEKPSSEEKAD